MKLLYTVNSPYARKVRIVAAEKHIDVQLQEVVLSSPDCPVKNYNPLGKVPVLVLADGDALYDSRVIAEYLDNRTPLAHLIPKDNSTKSAVRRWEALADGVCDAAVAVMLEQRKPDTMQDATFISKQMDKVIRGLTVLNNDLGQNKWCVDDSFSLADIAVGCTLGYLGLRFSQVINLAEDYANLNRLQTSLLQRQSFKDTLPVSN
ncbi:MAG: glutathione S-transferase [Methylotenera sp.]|uniref:glutathione S-transferase N-terminal domain-containing protein n=1 Tax=Methylotenera sp. TaxID=2051956 RepID=UPI000D4A4B5F|nr:glutathione S-transferase N-terminal domain-containing protein [Methylotenera sp.]PPC81799.1 MAG: glutathione S-transferase [Methylotenera sp.]